MLYSCHLQYRPALLVPLLPFLRANYLSVCHSDPSLKFLSPTDFLQHSTDLCIHVYVQDKLNPGEIRSLSVLVNLNLKDNNIIVKFILHLILQSGWPMY